VPRAATVIKQSATLILRALETNQTCSDGVGRFTPLWRSLEPIFVFERFNLRAVWRLMEYVYDLEDPKNHRDCSWCRNKLLCLGRAERLTRQ